MRIILIIIKISFGVIIILHLNLEHLLKENKRSKYWLVKQLDSNYTVINKMINHQTKSISFETLDKLLKIFECSPNELFKEVD